MHKTGILLINLGTPEAPNVRSIRRYLREFLLDPRVIDTAAPLRYLLVYGAILPFRAPKTTHAYQAIWQETGSPLRFHLERLTIALQENLGTAYTVVGAMRYGTPTMKAAIAALQDCQDIVLLPLFPQYSEAATGSAIAHAQKTLQQEWRHLQHPPPPSAPYATSMTIPLLLRPMPPPSGHTDPTPILLCCSATMDSPNGASTPITA